MAPRSQMKHQPVVDVDTAAGEVFQQRCVFIVKLRMNSGVWEPQHEAPTEEEARAFIKEQQRRFPAISPHDWGVFIGELTRIELRVT